MTTAFPRRNAFVLVMKMGLHLSEALKLNRERYDNQKLEDDQIRNIRSQNQLQENA